MRNYNQELSDAFNEIADLLSLLDDNPFKIRAYRQAARRLKEDFRPLTTKDARKEVLLEIPGIGNDLADKIIGYLKEGRIEMLEKLRGKIPEAVRELMKIPHLGPKRVRELFINLGIKSKEGLVAKAKSGEIERQPGFGKKLVGQILEGLESGQEKKRRHDRTAVEPIAQRILGVLRGIPGVSKAEVAGSYRRQSETVGDLDVLVVGEKAAAEAKKGLSETFPGMILLGGGETKVSFVIFPENLQVDIRFVPPESYGAALLYFTGDKNFNVMMRKKAIEEGMLLNEYGLFKEGEFVAGRIEEEVFEKLGLPFTLPQNRR